MPFTNWKPVRELLGQLNADCAILDDNLDELFVELDEVFGALAERAEQLAAREHALAERESELEAEVERCMKLEAELAELRSQLVEQPAV
ncbi:MAG: hypothetical protein KDA71_24230 [Planctomycetales bacterium]|nr:hypothetical protein [Planctomycetales bacterium]